MQRKENYFEIIKLISINTHIERKWYLKLKQQPWENL